MPAARPVHTSTIKEELMRKPVTILGRRFAAVLVGSIVGLLLGASVALAAAPSVHITRYSSTISGNIGAATAGVKVTAALVRAETTIETSPVATTNASGEWTAALAAHAPSDALDVIKVHYSGTGAPPESTYGEPSETGTKPGIGFFDNNISIAEDGASGGVVCTNFAEAKCAALSAHVAYSGGAQETVVGTPDISNEQIEELAFSPALKVNDVVTITGSFTEEDGSTLELTVPAPMPGLGNVFSGGGSVAPRCTADLVTLAVTCAPLSAGSYSLTQTRGVSSLGSTSASVLSGSEAAVFQLTTLQAADQLALSVAGAGGRLLTTLHAYKLAFNETETLSFGSMSAVITGGSCQANEWFGVSGGFGLCPANGVAAAGSPTAQEDELSGGATRVTPPLISYTSPMDGEDVYGPTITTFADLNTGGATPVTLTATPTGGSAIPATGNPNSASGATLGGLTAGKRYAASWSLTDVNSDVITLTTHFVDQSAGEGPAGKEGKEGPAGKEGGLGKEGPTGKEGGPGKEGSPGATGKEGAAGTAGLTGKDGAPGAQGLQGAEGPAGAAAEIICTSKKVKVTINHKTQTKTKTTCVVKQLAPGATITTTSLELRRGRIVYAVGRIKAGGGMAPVAMHDLKPVRAGEYTMTIVSSRGHAKTTTSYRVSVKGGRS
jgi:hypothetical protein